MASNIIEILTAYPSASPAPFIFTVNQALNKVDIVTQGIPFFMEAGEQNPCFQRKDNPTILGFGIQLPYCFGMADSVFNCALAWLSDDGTTIVNPIRFFIPIIGQQMPFGGANLNGLFFPYPDLSAAFPADQYARIHVAISGSVSMVNIPADEFPDGTVLPVMPWIQVQHQLPLVVGS